MRILPTVSLHVLWGAVILALVPLSSLVQAQDGFRVTGVKESDVLNVRSAPNAKAPIVGKIPAKASGIAQAGECRSWCRVRYAGVEGWVDKRFLEAEEPALPTVLAVQSKVDSQLQHLRLQNYEQDNSSVIASIEKGGQQRFLHRLVADSSYAIIGACDDSCGHVRLSLFEPNGALLVRSPDENSIVIVGGTPAASGPHVIELTVPGCQREVCQAGFAVARLTLKDTKADLAPQRERPSINVSKPKRGGTTIGGKTYRDF